MKSYFYMSVKTASVLRRALRMLLGSYWMLDIQIAGFVVLAPSPGRKDLLP